MLCPFHTRYSIHVESSESDLILAILSVGDFRQPGVRRPIHTINASTPSSMMSLIKCLLCSTAGKGTSNCEHDAR